MDVAAPQSPLGLSRPASPPSDVGRRTAPALALAATLVSIGLSWDISWHQTIGRDSFWTPAHLVIYLGGASGGLIAGWLAIRTTFLATAEERADSVAVWGGYAPFGAWVSIWGALAMITSAPFDNWWHEAYGLDVKILSPPHVLLFFGILGLRLGAGLLVLRQQNRTPTDRKMAWLFCWVGGLVFNGTIGLFLTQIWPNRQHSVDFFFLVAVLIPFFLSAIRRASTLRWGTTIAVGSGMLFQCVLLWVLPLFPATPKLGPIYNPVTHMVSAPFPMLTVLPAFVFDLLRSRAKLGQGWRRDLIFAAMAGVLFLVSFLPAQWEFAKFYLSPAANNAFFAGSRIWSYNTVPDSSWTEFFPDEAGWQFRSLWPALLGAVVSSFLGVRLGQWMAKVRR